MPKLYYTWYILILYLLTGCKLQQHEANAKLYQAVLTNEFGAVQKFLKKGASANFREGKRGWTPLLFAVEAENYEVATMLVDYGADVNMISTKNQVSPLQRAASKGQLKMINLLVRKGADINHQDTQLRSTPLMWACVHGHEDAARLLLDHGALINARGNRGESALFLAVAAEKVKLVKLLISYNAIRDRPDIYGITPIKKAKELKNTDIVNLLNN